MARGGWRTRVRAVAVHRGVACVTLINNMIRRFHNGLVARRPTFCTTLLNLAGSRAERFGMADPNLKDLDQIGPLDELLV